MIYLLFRFWIEVQFSTLIGLMSLSIKFPFLAFWQMAHIVSPSHDTARFLIFLFHWKISWFIKQEDKLIQFFFVFINALIISYLINSTLLRAPRIFKYRNDYFFKWIRFWGFFSKFKFSFVFRTHSKILSL